MENKEKTPEQKAAEKLRKAQAMGDAISHLNMKLGVVPNDMLIEEQIKYLSKYHDVPSVEEMKANENKMDSYRQEFMNKLYDNDTGLRGFEVRETMKPCCTCVDRATLFIMGNS